MRCVTSATKQRTTDCTARTQFLAKALGIIFSSPYVEELWSLPILSPEWYRSASLGDEVT
jgi:hypothetical protein